MFNLPIATSSNKISPGFPRFGIVTYCELKIGLVISDKCKTACGKSLYYVLKGILRDVKLILEPKGGHILCTQGTRLRLRKAKTSFSAMLKNQRVI
jgi:hypothetical protein